MYSGESLVRQFYFGKKWLKKEFNYNANVYWNVDVPSKVLQMPQILKKSGTDFMVISRFEKGIYNWYSPDGSYVTTYSPGHYSDAFTPLHKNIFDAASYIAESSLYFNKYYSTNSSKNVAPILSDWDMSPAEDYSHIINNWSSIKEVQIHDNNYLPIELPKIKIKNASDYLKEFTANAVNIPKILGERPDVWLYIHGPSHYEALKASREVDIMLTMAEKFSTINALLKNDFNCYPENQLNKAWESKIYPDHGWGGKEGQQTDDLFLSKFVFANLEAAKLTEQALQSIASKIKTENEKGIPIIVFNSLNWERNDPVKFRYSFEKGKGKNIIIKDFEGKEILAQLSNLQKYDDGSIKSATISFIADNVPSLGYKTFYISVINNSELQPISSPFESDFYKIELDNGGIKSIFDKELNVELIDTSEFKGGEIFTLKSEGNGAGEFSDVQQPTMDGFDKTGKYKTNWIIEENGPVYSSIKFRQKIKNTVVDQKIILYKKIKKIDFETALLNWEGVLYREYRFAFPLNMKNGKVYYETAFGVIEVRKDEIPGAAGERYTTICKDIHPRSIENWIGADNNKYGVTLSSCVAVADYIDPINKKEGNIILQPILLASRKSCHELGNEYLQTGDHYYKFSITSHKPGWENGYQFGKNANENLQVVVNPSQYKNASLKEKNSFFSLDNCKSIISAIKKSEDDNSIIVRLYDILGKDSDIKLISFKDINEVTKTNLIEEDQKKLTIEKNVVKFKLGHNAIETLKINFKN